MTPARYLRTYLRYRRDPLARDLAALPWVAGWRDALARADAMRARSVTSRQLLASELRLLGLTRGALDLLTTEE